MENSLHPCPLSSNGGVYALSMKNLIFHFNMKHHIDKNQTSRRASLSNSQNGNGSKTASINGRKTFKGPGSNASSRRASNASVQKNNDFNSSRRSSNIGSPEKNSNFQIGDQNSLADSTDIPIEEDLNESSVKFNPN